MLHPSVEHRIASIREILDHPWLGGVAGSSDSADAASASGADAGAVNGEAHTTEVTLPQKGPVLTSSDDANGSNNSLGGSPTSVITSTA